MTIQLQPSVKILWDYVETYKNSYDYQYMPEKTTKQVIRKLADILWNELTYHIHKIRHRNDSDFDNEFMIQVISWSWSIYQHDKKRFDIAIFLHEKREAERRKKRYKNWKSHSKSSLESSEVCGRCGSTQSLELDHVTDHNGFREDLLAYDVLNSQYLCNSCNQLKKSGDDFRTPEVIMAQKNYVTKNLKGRSVIY